MKTIQITASVDPGLRGVRPGITPNQVTLARVIAAFGAVALFAFFGDTAPADAAAILLTIAAIALDGVDGYLARTRGLATPVGAQLDILGDRVVENLFFTLFAVTGLVTLWVPVLFFVRGALTDFLRGLAGRAGRSGFGRQSMIQTRWGRALAASRASRGAYAALKCACFCYLGLMIPLTRVGRAWMDGRAVHVMWSAGQILVAATVAFCILRAIPVVWEGRRYLAGEPGEAETGHAAATPEEVTR